MAKDTRIDDFNYRMCPQCGSKTYDRREIIGSKHTTIEVGVGHATGCINVQRGG